MGIYAGGHSNNIITMIIQADDTLQEIHNKSSQFSCKGLNSVSFTHQKVAGTGNTG